MGAERKPLVRKGLIGAQGSYWLGAWGVVVWDAASAGNLSRLRPDLRQGYLPARTAAERGVTKPRGLGYTIYAAKVAQETPDAGPKP